MAAPNRTAYAILGFLTVKPMSGYDVKKAVEASIDNFWKESYGQIYPILKRLSEEGSIEKSESATGGKRPRHLYTITERGREKLKSWLREPTEPSPVRMELLLKLFFGSQVDHNTNRRQIEDYRERMVAELARYRAITAKLEQECGDNPDLPYWLMTLRFGERDHEAHIAWCDEALTLLDGIPGERGIGATVPSQPLGSDADATDKSEARDD